MVSLEIRASQVTERADVVLPVSLVQERSGTFWTWEGRERSFGRVIEVPNGMSDLRVLAALADGLPEDVVRVAESGVESEEQIKAYAAAGADVVLVGEALVRHGAPEEALRAFRAASLTVR